MKTILKNTELNDYLIKLCAKIGRDYKTDNDREKVINELNELSIEIIDRPGIKIKVMYVIPLEGEKSIKGGFKRITKYNLALISFQNENNLNAINEEFYFCDLNDGRPAALMINSGFFECTTYKVKFYKDETIGIEKYDVNNLEGFFRK